MSVRSKLDLETLDACRRGERAALERVLRLHSRMLERTLARLSGSSAELPDLLQETLTTACRAFKSFRGDSSVQTWLVGIALQVTRAYFREPRHRRQILLHAEPEPVTPHSLVDAQIDGRLLLYRAFADLDALGEKKRQAFMLHVANGRSIAEIADMLGVNALTVK